MLLVQPLDVSAEVQSLLVVAIAHTRLHHLGSKVTTSITIADSGNTSSEVCRC